MGKIKNIVFERYCSLKFTQLIAVQVKREVPQFLSRGEPAKLVFGWQEGPIIILSQIRRGGFQTDAVLGVPIADDSP